MCFVIDDHDVFYAHQVWYDTLQHLPFSFNRVQFFASTLKQRPPAFRYINSFAQFEGVVVCDNDFGSFDITDHIVGNKFTALIIAIGIIRLQDAKPVANGYAGGDNKEASSEFFALWSSCCIYHLPGNNHGHDGGFACACGKFECQTGYFRVGIVVGIFEVVEKSFTCLPCLWSYLCEPDCRFDRFDLAEKRFDTVELVVPPVLQKPGCFWSYLPVVWIWNGSPFVNLLPNSIDKGGLIVLLLFT